MEWVLFVLMPGGGSGAQRKCQRWFPFRELSIELPQTCLWTFSRAQQLEGILQGQMIRCQPGVGQQDGVRGEVSRERGLDFQKSHVPLVKE